MLTSLYLDVFCRCRRRQRCAARLDHLAVHLFVVMTTIISVIGVTALLLIRLDVIQGRRASCDVIQEIVIIADIVIICLS